MYTYCALYGISVNCGGDHTTSKQGKQQQPKQLQ